MPDKWKVDMGRDLHVLNRTFLQNASSHLRYWDPLICLVPFPEPEETNNDNNVIDTTEGNAPQKVVGGVVSSSSAPQSIRLRFKKWEKRHEEAVQDSAPLPMATIPAFVPPSAVPNFTDQVRKMCLLCFRQFDSNIALMDHVEKSQLHASNLEAYQRLDREEYKDRAEERRSVYKGDGDGGKRQRCAVQRADKPLPSDNVGAQLLKKMGWQEGQGLGPDSSGIVEPIRAHSRSKRSGIGRKQ